MYFFFFIARYQSYVIKFQIFSSIAIIVLNVRCDFEVKMTSSVIFLKLILPKFFG
jgi:hypothetical protein